jgi:hypothetical protein
VRTAHLTLLGFKNISCFLFPLPSSLFPLFTRSRSLDSPLPSFFLLPSSFFLLPSSFFLLPSSFFLLPSSFFLLPSSFFLLPSKTASAF